MRASLAHLLVFAASSVYAAYDTVFEKKCSMLKEGKDMAAYIGDSCFVAMDLKIEIEFEKYGELDKKCMAINGYRAHLAKINDRSVVDALVASNTVKVKGKYLVGGRQTVHCKTNPCAEGEHAKNWFWFGADGKENGKIDSDVWITSQPDNGGSPPEYAVALERLEGGENYKPGLNDINPEADAYSILCEYEDFLMCKDGYTLVRDKCFKFVDEPDTFQGSNNACEEDGATLASIHDDSQNKYMIQIARDGGIDTGSKKPVRFAMANNGEDWRNYDGSEVDYFRWYDQNGCGNPVPFKKGGVGAALVASSIATEHPNIGYWLVKDHNEKLPYICQADPKKRY